MPMKKIALGSVAVAAASLLLAGCAGGTSAGTSTGAALDTTLPDSSTSATLNIWGYVEPGTTDSWMDASKAALAAEYPNVTVDYTYIPYDQIAAKLLGTAVSGDGPDGIVYNPADAAKLAQSGVLADMTPFWNDFADADQFPSTFVWNSDDKIVSLQGYTNTTALFYNKKILDELGIAPPTTVEELDAALQKVHDAGYGGMVMSANPTAESEFQILPWLFGEGQNYGAWDTDVVEGVFQQFTDWIDAGYIPREVVGYTQGDAWDQFSGGDFAFVQNGNWQLGLAADLPFDWGVVELPAGSDGSHAVGGGEGFSIGAHTKNPALTWKFFEQGLLTKDSELALLDQYGSLPARADAADSPAIADDPALQVFSQVVANMQARPSNPEIGDEMLELGKIWNSVAGGATSPADGAAQVSGLS